MEQTPQVIAFPQPKKQPKPRPFGYLVSRRGRLSVRFTYFGEVVQKSTGLEDTPENREKSRAFLDEIGRAIQAGTFRFAEAFPNATEEEKVRWARVEGLDYRCDPERVTVGGYLERWLPSVTRSEPSASKRRDYKRHIKTYIRPYFAELSFSSINGVVVKDFVLQLRRQNGPRKGEPLAGSTTRNILSVFRAVWDDACEEYGWHDLPDPLDYVRRKNRKNQIIPRKRRTSPEAFRPDEWFTLVGAMEPHYRPAIEIMVLTGMIASEIAGLRKIDVQEDRIVICNSIVAGVEKSSLKTDYRAREIPLTAAIRERLDEAIARADGDHLFRMATGSAFEADNFRKNAWARAMRKAGISYRRPYAMRHTFAAWSLIVGIHPERLVRLMGHGSKQMVYEVYGKFVNGLDLDRDRIREYFGEDYR
jgi:integrase